MNKKLTLLKLINGIFTLINLNGVYFIDNIISD